MNIHVLIYLGIGLLWALWVGSIIARIGMTGGLPDKCWPRIVALVVFYWLFWPLVVVGIMLGWSMLVALELLKKQNDDMATDR